MSDEAMQGTVLPQQPSDNARQELTLFSKGLLSKWGFGDGDEPDWLLDILDEEGLDYPDVETWHEVLWRLVNEHLIPVLDQHVETVQIGTNHNPVRARTVDGVDVTDQWMQDAATQLTPESVSIPVDRVLDLIRQAAEADLGV